MKLGEWGHAARCSKCPHGMWDSKLMWEGSPAYEQFIANGGRQNVCAKCGNTGWCKDIGRQVSTVVWWNPFTWKSEPRWEWKGLAPPVAAPPPPPPSFREDPLPENVVPLKKP